MSIQQLQSQQGFGSWAGESVEDIEAYLVNSQRKFVKYRLNIFVLNRVSLAVCPPRGCIRFSPVSSKLITEAFNYVLCVSSACSESSTRGSAAAREGKLSLKPQPGLKRNDYCTRRDLPLKLRRQLVAKSKDCWSCSSSSSRDCMRSR